jgi:hypothetical protein
MKRKTFNFSDVRIGFSCPFDMERKILEESRRLCDSKSGIVRRALLFYFENTQNTIGGAECYGKQS